MPPPRRFPPWRAERIPGGYVIRDANGQTLAWITRVRTRQWRGRQNALTFDEARRVASNIARLPELLGRSGMNDPMRKRSLKVSY